jgi:hypothetical protein
MSAVSDLIAVTVRTAVSEDADGIARAGNFHQHCMGYSVAATILINRLSSR